MTSSQIKSQARQKLTGKWGKVALMTLVFIIITFVISFVLELIPTLGSIISMVIASPLSFGFIFSMFKINDDNEVGYFDFLITGFSNFGKVWSIILQTLLKLILPVLYIVASYFISEIVLYQCNQIEFSGGIINAVFGIFFLLVCLILLTGSIVYMIYKVISYNLAYFIAYDNPDISGKDAVAQSAELMKGNVGSLICLDLSFIGWAILLCALGLGLVWLIPYMGISISWMILSLCTLGFVLVWLIPYIKISEINFYRNLTGEIKYSEPEPDVQENL